jgi:putative ABC transport system substrate-binding protein
MSARGAALAVLVISLGALPAESQDVARVHRIGVLTELSEKSVENWRSVLAKRGYVEGEKATFVYRAAEGNFDLLPKLAQELVERQVDIILTISTPSALAAKHATSTTPIVTMSADPIGTGLIESLAKPGGNVTGLFLPLAELAAKRLQLLKEAVSDLNSVVILWNPNNPPARFQLDATEAAARSLGIKSYAVEIGSQNELKPALQKITARHAGGLVIVQDPVTLSLSPQLAEFSIQNRLPASHAYRRFVDAGGLMCYGFSLSGLWEAGAVYADKILRGARPEELPMEQPTRVEVVINLRAAKALRLQIPESILLRADEVIR